ncbi:ketose 1,6-bisphosphate aldolase [Oryzibacter oryziterrae]|uniref:ketose 1,6-bisphosphate aldolase n=1 Tax=Oryzibacter oryziterrae TaxID=2766474 RepID=UPI001F2EDCA8|nr:ketose 1,6-bisphosphate aldolase [Oryzibacter oryziterrae]
MPLISLADMLKTARAGKFGVGAFNGVDSHYIDAIFDAAKRLSSPIIINVAEVHLKFFELEDMAAYVRYKASASNLPVTLNLDHGLTMPTVMRALEAGFTSVMFDGSHLPYEENVRQTAEVVKLAHARGISVEGELGAVGGDEGGNLEGAADVALYTDTEQAVDYVRSTGIDALAVAIGNSHGKYKGVPKLDFDRLAVLNQRMPVPLVLHGGSGLSVDDFQRSISLGIAKINFFTGMSQAALDAMASGLADDEIARKYDHYLFTMQRVRKGVSEAVAEQMRIFGSVDKASHYAA